MRYGILFIAVMWGLLMAVEPALASCTTSTVFTPDGRTIVCTSCCDAAGNCTVTCY